MSVWFFLFCVLPLIFGVAGVLIGAMWWRVPDSDVSAFAMTVGVCALALGGITWGIAGFTEVMVSYDERQCERYGAQTERDVRFARYNRWSWDCLVDTDGGWIPKSQLYVNEGRPYP